MKKDSLYYEDPPFVIGNHEYHTYICDGIRSRGKTTLWADAAGYRSIKEQIDIFESGGDGSIDAKHKFVFIRRATAQLDLVLASGLFEQCRRPEKYREHWQGVVDTYKDNRVYVKMDGYPMFHIGYYYDLNTVKGISVEDADCLIFDEYIELERGKYKGGEGGIHEPEILARLDETLFRRRENWMVLLANQDSPTDPYKEYFHIPFGASSWRDRDRGLIYEFDTSPAAVEDKLNTTTGQRWKGTSYGGYSVGANSLGEITPEMILPRPKHSRLMFNVRINRTDITVWEDPEHRVYYFTDDCKFDNNLPIYSATRDDMSVNTNFVTYCSDFIQLMKLRFGRGSVRFNSQKTATLFMLMMNIR